MPHYRSYVAEYWRKDGKMLFTGRYKHESSRWQTAAMAQSYLDSVMSIGNNASIYDCRVRTSNYPAEIIRHCERAQVEQSAGCRCQCGHIVTVKDCRLASMLT